MGISLSKGQKISLQKEAPQMTNIIVGMGWKTNPRPGETFDLDACAFLVDENDKMLDEKGFVFFNNNSSNCTSVNHQGDNRTGEGDGDDEQIKVDLTKVPENVKKIIFYGVIFDAIEKNQTFGQVSDAYIRLVDERNGTEIAKFDLSEDYSTDRSICLGELYRNNGEWKFNSKGEGSTSEIGTILEKHQ